MSNRYIDKDISRALCLRTTAILQRDMVWRL